MTQKHNIIRDFVKIDVEGAESMVLNGSLHLAQKRNTKFIIKMHHSLSIPMRENSNKVLIWCKAMDFKAWYLEGKSELLSPESIAHQGRCHLLIQPSNWQFPEYLLNVNAGNSIRK